MSRIRREPNGRGSSFRRGLASRTRTVAVITLCIIAVSVPAVAWFKSATTAPLTSSAPVFQSGSLSPSNPSRENVYLGGRLVATESFGPGCSAPALSGLSPSSRPKGLTAGPTCFELTINGTNMSGTTAVTFSNPTGITVSNIQNISSTEVKCNVSIGSAAALGQQTVSVTTCGQSTNTQGFTVTAAPTYQGFLDAAGCGIITGWAWNANDPDGVINVDIYDGTTLIATIPANLFREDIHNAGIGNGFHGFSFTTPPSLKNSQNHTIRAKFPCTTIELSGSPRTLNCSNTTPLYQGYHDGAGCNTIAGWAWNQNDPNNPINVDIYVDGSFHARVPAIQYRPDLVAAGIGNGFHGFSYTVPASLKNNVLHSITVKFPDTATNLGNTPRNITCTGAPPIFEGVHEVANCSTISGWAWDQNDPNMPINVAIYADGQLIATILAIQFRQDLVTAGKGNGYHAFSYPLPANLKNNQPHSITVKYSGTQTNLTSTPRTINCPP